MALLNVGRDKSTLNPLDKVSVLSKWLALKAVDTAFRYVMVMLKSLIEVLESGSTEVSSEEVEVSRWVGDVDAIAPKNHGGNLPVRNDAG